MADRDAGNPANGFPRPAQSARRPGKRRVVRIVVLSLFGVVLVALAWGGWQLWQLGSNLLELRDVAAQAQSDIRGKDVTALAEDLRCARTAASQAGAAADAPAVGLASRLPWIGDDVTVARELARAAAELGAGTTGLDPLLSRVASGGSQSLLADPATHDAVVQVRDAANAAARRLGKLDLSDLALPVGDDVTKLRDGLAKVGATVDALLLYLDAVGILSSPGEKHGWMTACRTSASRVLPAA